MDKFFHSTFDFFSHALPGIFFVASLLLLDPGLNHPYELMTKSDQFKINELLLLAFVGYVVGFAIHPIGRFLYKTLGSSMWNEPIANNIDMFISDKYVLIRQFSPANFKYVETWNMFCAMAHNLAVASFVSTVCSAYKLLSQDLSNRTFWFIFCIASLIMFFIFLQRAVRFSTWASHDLNAAIARLRLAEKVDVDEVHAK